MGIQYVLKDFSLRLVWGGHIGIYGLWKIMHFPSFFLFSQIWAAIKFRENILGNYSIFLFSSTGKSLLPLLPLLNSSSVFLPKCQILECVHFYELLQTFHKYSIPFKYINWKMGIPWWFLSILSFIYISDNFIKVSVTWRTNNSKNIKWKLKINPPPPPAKSQFQGHGDTTSMHTSWDIVFEIIELLIWFWAFLQLGWKRETRLLTKCLLF